MPRHLPVRDLRALGALALSSGAQALSPLRSEWDIAGGCLNPKHVDLWGRQERGRPQRLVATSIADFVGRATQAHMDRGTYSLEMWVKCRKCTICLRARAREWAARARAEVAVAPRTWFGTLTLSPHWHSQMAMRARQRLAKGGLNFEHLDAEQEFKERHREIGAELQLWLKRVRKNSGAKLRYILVAEAHKSGLPHYHCLIHEASAVPVSYRDLTKAWKLGFTEFNLVQEAEKPAWYVCKYLSKDALARVRASRLYGS